ncbi:hypothetical protein [Sulfitobacter sp. W027]|uniref:hypothetical protein n=1 Tax=Sulfitobacter sp. W027 TaxID=2867025 RepID=UPI0038FCEE44
MNVLVQTGTVRSAPRAEERLVIEDRANHYTIKAILSGDRDEQREKLHELVALLEKRAKRRAGNVEDAAFRAAYEWSQKSARILQSFPLRLRTFLRPACLRLYQ